MKTFFAAIWAKVGPTLTKALVAAVIAFIGALTGGALAPGAVDSILVALGLK
jgi:hypothetical protein